MTQQDEVNQHDRFFSNSGNVWRVLGVEANWAQVIRECYYWDGNWFFPDNETPARFDVCALQGMRKMDALGFFVA